MRNSTNALSSIHTRDAPKELVNRSAVDSHCSCEIGLEVVSRIHCLKMLLECFKNLPAVRLSFSASAYKVRIGGLCERVGFKGIQLQFCVFIEGGDFLRNKRAVLGKTVRDYFGWKQRSPEQFGKNVFASLVLVARDFPRDVYRSSTNAKRDKDLNPNGYINWFDLNRAAALREIAPRHECSQNKCRDTRRQQIHSFQFHKSLASIRSVRSGIVSVIYFVCGCS